MWWFKTGTHRVHPERTPILNIFPTILDYYGVSAHQANGSPRRGHSIADQIGRGRYRPQPLAAAAE